MSNKPRFSLVLYERGFSGRPLAFDLRFEVDELSRARLGGPKAARVRAYGALGELVRLAGCLRCPAEIWAEGRRAWWGYLAGVGIPALGVGASLLSLANRVSVRLSNGIPTGFEDDLESQAIYGVRERIYMVPGELERSAAAYQAARLGRQAWPGQMLPVELQPAAGDLGSGLYGERSEAPGANLALLGWWESLDWRYWERSAGQLEKELGMLAEDFTLSFGTPTARAVRQLFGGVTRACTLRQVKLRLLKVGTPVDSLVVSVLDGSSEEVVTSAELLGMKLSTSVATVTITLPPAAVLPGELYVQVHRTGETSVDHYYKIGGVNWTASYTAKILGNTGWVDYGAGGEDLAFELWVWPDEETTVQARRIVEEAGQFIAGVQVEGVSGVLVESYWIYDRALRRVEALLEMGTSAGAWMAAEVGPDRVLRMGPAKTAELSIDGRQVWDGRRELERWEVPAGRWIRSTGAPGLWVDGDLSGAGRAFIGEVVYDARRDRVKIVPAGDFDQMSELAERLQGYLG